MILFGRRAMLERIHHLHIAGDHISVVGPRSMGKTALLEVVRRKHADGSDLFAGAELLDLRHNQPDSIAAALRQVGGALREMFRRGPESLRYVVDEIRLELPAEPLFERLDIALAGR